MDIAKNKVIKHIILIGIFFLGIVCGLFLWDKIVFPFKNPWNVVGPLSIQEYNPVNDLVRFSVFILLPSLMLFSLVFFYGKKLNQILFHSEKNEVDLQQKQCSEHFSSKKRIIFFAFLIAFTIAIAVNNRTYHASGGLDTFHEGETLGTAVSYMEGQAPYKDILFLHGVFQDPLRSVLAFKLFGRSIGAMRTLDSILKIITFILLSLFLVKIFRENPLFSLISFVILSFLFALADVGFNITKLRFYSILDTRDIMTFSFLIVAAFLRDFLDIKSDPKERKKLFVVLVFLFSFLPIVSFGYSIDRGFFLLAANLVLSPLLYFFIFRKNIYRTFYLVFSLLGLVAGILVLLILMRDGFYEFLRFTFFIMPRYKELLDGLVYPIHQPFFLAPCILVAAIIYWITFKFIEEFHMNDRQLGATLQSFLEKYFIEFCMMLLSIFFFRAALGSSDWDEVAMNPSPILYTLSLIIIFRHYTKKHLMDRIFQKRFAYCTISVAVIILFFALYRIYDKKLIADNFPLQVKDSHLIPETYKPAVSFLKENLDEKEDFFTMTSEAIWYYFLDKPCPSRFSVVWFAGPEFYQKEIIEDLKKGNVKFILYGNRSYSNVKYGIINEIRLPVLVDFIVENYVFFKEINGHEIWIRESEVEEINEEMLGRRGIVFARRGRFEESISHFKAALKINNDYEEGHMHLGSVFLSLKYLIEAKHHFLEVLRINPYADRAHFYLGIISFNLEDIQGAVLHFEQALRINPGNKQARRNLEKIQKMIRKYQ